MRARLEKACWVLPSKKEAPQVTDLPDNWLQKLFEIADNSVAESLRGKLRRRVNVHVGEDSTYKLKKEVLDGLKVLYGKFTHPDTKPDEKTSLTLKLLERAEECTPGFHNGVNQLVQSFGMPKTLDELLYQVRYEMVEKAALSQSNEIHNYNRFFTLASRIGYGIYPINSRDVYTGSIIDNDIKQILARAFRFFPLLNGLISQCNSVLCHLGYMGRKTTGYKRAEMDGFTSFLSEIFKLHPDVIQGRFAESNIPRLQKNLDTKKKQKETSLTLIKDDLKALLETDANADPLKLLLSSENDKESPEDATTYSFDDNKIVRFLLMQEGGIKWPQVNSFMETCPDDLKTKLIETKHLYLAKQFMTDEEKRIRSQMTSDEEKVRKYRSLFLIENDDNTVIDLNWSSIKKMFFDIMVLNNKYVTFELVDARLGESTLLIQALQYHPAALLYVLAQMDSRPAKRVEMLQYKTIFGVNTLMCAVRHHESVDCLLNAMDNYLDPTQKVKIITQLTLDENNALMMAASYSVASVNRLLMAMEKVLTPSQIKTMLRQVNANGLNVLMIAAYYKPDTLPALGAAISKHQITPDDFNVRQIDYPFFFKELEQKPQRIPEILKQISGLDAQLQNMVLGTQTYTHNLWGSLSNPFLVFEFYQAQITKILTQVDALKLSNSTLCSTDFKNALDTREFALLYAKIKETRALPACQAAPAVLDIVTQFLIAMTIVGFAYQCYRAALNYAKGRSLVLPSENEKVINELEDHLDVYTRYYTPR